jgi:hypothetical protein
LYSNLLIAQNDSFTAYYTSDPITVDGIADEEIWDTAHWYPLSYVWIPYGQSVSAGDFTGRFKISWDENFLYLMVEVVDDSLYDGHTNPLENYWDDDCVEVFLDEDKSGGNHLNNFNAFAYHVGTLLDAVDNTTSVAALFNNDVDAFYTKSADTYTWELAIKIFNDEYVYGANNTPEILSHGKVLGFSLAYCDNDGSSYRENFIGSKYLPEAQANNGYINADVFGKLTLIDLNHITGLFNTKNDIALVYPSLISDQLSLKIDGEANEPIEILITDISGVKQYRYTINKPTINVISIDTSILDSGLYFVSLQCNGKSLISKVYKI